jgi:purine-cytosine permease-like protein
VLPPGAGWAVLTLIIGLLFTVLAVLGFETLSRFAQLCSPWLFPIFIAGAVATLPRLGVKHDFSNFWEIAQTRIWTGVPAPGYEPFHLGHIAFFAWFANLAMHIGLSDLAIFRYAKDWKYGLYSAFGMFPGHFLAWICSGVMVAGVDRAMDPGLMAYQSAGVAGVMAVLIAGWTTANPTLYRAGLALQTVTPNWSRWKVTVGAGLITTVLACSPVFFLKLLDYVAIYGLVLMPVGAIVFAEHWILPRIGVDQYRAQTLKRAVNWNAAIVWAGTLTVSAVLPFHLFFRWLPCYFLALGSYSALQYLTRQKLPVLVEQPR